MYHNKSIKNNLYENQDLNENYKIDKNIIIIKNKNIFIKWVLSKYYTCSTFEIFNDNYEIINIFDKGTTNDKYYKIIEENIEFIRDTLKEIYIKHQEIYDNLIENLPLELEDYKKDILL